MALSNSFNFTLNRDALVKRALLMLGVIDPDQTPTAAELADGGEVLNLLLKSWQADGLQLWQVNQVSVTPIASTGSYTFGDGTNTSYQPTDVLEVYRKETSSDVWVEVNRYSRAEFNHLSDHDSTGTPVNYYYNNDRNEGTLQVWPVPDSNFATNYTLEVLVTKPFDDMDQATDNLAFPQYYELAVVLNLARHLAREYGNSVKDRQELIIEAEQAKRDAMDWDTEHTSIFITTEPNFNG